MANRSTCIYICFLVGISLGEGQNSVQIQVTSPIRLRQDDLRITCSARGSYDSITSYAILKNDSNGIVSQVVMQSYSISTSQVTTTWTDTNLRSRASLTGVALPSAQATMILTVPNDQVRCPGDAVGYQCEFGAIVTAGGSSPQTQSSMQYVDISTLPSSTQPIVVQAEFNGQSVPTMTNGRHVFASGTMLTLSCAAEVGSNMQTQHWCHKREQDFSWDSPPSGVSNGEVIQTGCQYFRVSTYVLNVSANDDTRMILCEIGGNTQCGYGDFNSNLTIYLSATFPTTSDLTESTSAVLTTSGSPNITQPTSSSSSGVSVITAVVPVLIVLLVSILVITALILNQRKLKRKLQEEIDQRNYQDLNVKQTGNKEVYTDLKTAETSTYTNDHSSQNDRRMYDQLNLNNTTENVYIIPAL